MRLYMATLVERDDNKLECVIYQPEIGESGTPHYQGVAHFSQPMTLKRLNREILRCHWEKVHSQSNFHKAAKYCTKEDTRAGEPVHLGVPPHQGHRSDLDEIYDLIKRGANESTIMDLYPSQYIRYYKGIRESISLHHRTTLRVMPAAECVWYYGQTGVGKSHLVAQETSHLPPISVCWKNCNNKWWTGFRESTKVAVLDEFGAGGQANWPIGALLSLINEVPLSLEFKGGAFWRSFEKIYITSNLLPWELFSGVHPNHMQALKRRIKVYEITRVGDVTSKKSLNWP
jgi:hypothetical protein